MHNKIINKLLASIICFSLISVPLSGYVYGAEVSETETDALEESEEIAETSDTGDTVVEETTDEATEESSAGSSDTLSDDEAAVETESEEDTYELDSAIADVSMLGASAGNSEGASITFNGTTAEVSGSDSVTMDGSNPAKVSITESGTYTLTGNAEDIMISVASGLEVSFDVLDLTVDNSSNKAYFVQTGNNAVVNIDISGSTEVSGGAGLIKAPESTVNIYGSDSLTVENSSDDAVLAKNGTINIESGNITIKESAGDALKAKKGTVNINGGSVTLTECKDDGIQAENVNISGGILNIDTYYENAATGYYAAGTYSSGSSSDSKKNYLWESGDTVKYERFNVDTGSHKGIKAGTKAKSYVFSDDSSKNDSDTASGALSITGGTITIDTRKSGLKANGLSTTEYTATGSGKYIIGSPDDAISSNNDMDISGGTINIYSGDDGISAMGEIDITGNSVINIYNAYEGIEGQTVNIGSSGSPEITIYSCDDGINTSGKTLTYTYDTYSGYEKNDEVNYTKKSVSTTTGNNLNIFNGTIYVYIDSESEKSAALPSGSLSSLKSVVYRSSGDGIDCNGALDQRGGSLYVYGQSSGDNSPIDTNDGFTFESGARVLGTGVDGMNESKPESGSGSYITYGSGDFGNGVPGNGDPGNSGPGNGEPPTLNSVSSVDEVESGLDSAPTDNGGTPPGGDPGNGGTPPSGDPGNGGTPPSGDPGSGMPASGGTFSAGQYWVVLDSSNAVVDFGELKYSGSFIVYGSDTIKDGTYTLSVVDNEPRPGDIVNAVSQTAADTSVIRGSFAIGESTYEYSYTGTVSYNGMKLSLDDFAINEKEAGSSISGNVIFKKLRYKNNRSAGTGYAIPVFKAEKGSDSTVKKAVKDINKYFRKNPLEFTITARSLSGTNISGSATYYSKSGKWKFKLKADTGASKLIKLRYKANGKGDFTVSGNAINDPSPSVKITGTGNYTGTAEISNVTIK